MSPNREDDTDAARVDPTEVAVHDFQRGHRKEESFRLLFETYQPAVFGFFRNRGFAVDESQDLTQEAFVHLYQGLDNFRRASSFRTWFFHIVTNVYRNALRARVAQKRSAPERSLEAVLESSVDEEAREFEPTEPGAGPQAAALERERLDALAEALERMPDKMRHAMMLRLHHDLTYRQIASVMQVSIDTVKAHIYNARRRLEELKDFYTLDDL